jgi:nitroimidazol reductase NimA-like FMN-containing flavoprotein (pyridoxamine 5'-phosphate oxidase superfamily)
VEEQGHPSRRSVRLSADESWATVERGHTGIFTTLRRDGVPVPLPVWYVVLDRRIYVTTPTAAKKVARLRYDPRASFLVESGERWAELKAVLLTGVAFLVDDDDLRERVRGASDEKYAGYRLERKKMPSETRERYGRMGALICFEPHERIVSWDNARLFD